MFARRRWSRPRAARPKAEGCPAASSACVSATSMETGSSYRSFSCLFAMSVLWSKRVSLACRASRGSVARQAVARRTGRRVRHGDVSKKGFFYFLPTTTLFSFLSTTCNNSRFQWPLAAIDAAPPPLRRAHQRRVAGATSHRPAHLLSSLDLSPGPTFPTYFPT